MHFWKVFCMQEKKSFFSQLFTILAHINNIINFNTLHENILWWSVYCSWHCEFPEYNVHINRTVIYVIRNEEWEPQTGWKKWNFMNPDQTHITTTGADNTLKSHCWGLKWGDLTKNNTDQVRNDWNLKNTNAQMFSVLFLWPQKKNTMSYTVCTARILWYSHLK